MSAWLIILLLTDWSELLNSILFYMFNHFLNLQLKILATYQIYVVPIGTAYSVPVALLCVSVFKAILNVMVNASQKQVGGLWSLNIFLCDCYVIID